MESLIVWIIWLLFLLVLCLIQSPRVLLTPQFGFVGCFVPQAFYALFYVQEWNLDFSFVTSLILIGGTTLFVIVSFAASYILDRKKIHFGKTRYNKNANNIMDHQYKKAEIHIETWKLVMLAILQFVICVLVMRYINTNAAGSTFIEKLVTINNTNKFGDIEDTFSLPKGLARARTFCMASSYIYMYLLLHSLILKYKGQRALLIINILFIQF